jgi:hypothetical protein
MSPKRLSAEELEDHLASESGDARRLVRTLRRMVLSAVPSADESLKFGCLCYYRADALFGAIGGNICMKETRRRKLTLSFIHGASLPDHSKLLRGRGKAKRFIPIENAAQALDRSVISLVQAAARSVEEP